MGLNDGQNQIYRGGGIFIKDCSPNIENNTIYYNQVGITTNIGQGGGIYCYSSANPSNCSPYIGTSNIIILNFAGNGEGAYGSGGGIYCNKASPYIINNTIGRLNQKNRSFYGHGGGICCVNGSKAIILHELEMFFLTYFIEAPFHAPRSMKIII